MKWPWTKDSPQIDTDGNPCCPTCKSLNVRVERHRNSVELYEFNGKRQNGLIKDTFGINFDVNDPDRDDIWYLSCQADGCGELSDLKISVSEHVK